MIKNTYYELLQNFRETSEITINASEAFLCFLIVTRYFDINNIKVENIDIETIKMYLINAEEINFILNYLEFDKIQITNDSITKAWDFASEITKIKNMSAAYNLGNVLHGIIREKSEEGYKNIFKKIIVCEDKLNIMSICRTEALLLLSNYVDNQLYIDIIKSYLYSSINKIYVISYNNSIFSEEDYKNIIDDYYINTENNFINKIVFKGDAIKNFDYLEGFVNEMEENSFLIIIGAERLTNIISSKAKVKTHFEKSQINLHTVDSIDWKYLTIKIHELITTCQSKRSCITIGISTEDHGNIIEKNICDNSTEFNSFDIIRYDVNTNNVEYNLLNLLFSGNYIEYNEQLEKFRDEITEDNYYLLSAFSALMINDYLKAEEWLKKLSREAPLENMLILSNIYIHKQKYKEALDNLIKIYDRDKYLTNLMSAIMECVSKLQDNNLFEEWINKAFDVDDKDCNIIQYVANYYTSNKLYDKSSVEWEKLYNLTNNVEYELLKDINIMLSKEDEYKLANIIDVLNEYSKCHPSMETEVNYRIGLIALENKNDYKKGLEYLSKVNTEINAAFSYQSAKKRLQIYNNKILKINSNNKAILKTDLMKFANELIRDIPVLTCEDKGNYTWSNYIENTIPYERWKHILIEIIGDKLEEWSKIDFDLVCRSKLNIDANELMNKFIKAENQGILNAERIDENLIILLFTAIGYMEQGQPQMANDTIFTLFSLASTIEDTYYKNIAIIFGLLAWSNSNYKIGEEVESMVSLIAAIDLAISQEEINFVFMFGFNNLLDFLYNNSKYIKLDSIKKDALHKLFQNPYSKEYINKFYSINNDYDKVINNRLKYFKEIESLWGKNFQAKLIITVKEEEEEFFANELKVLINAYHNKGLIYKACEYIERYSDSIAINLIQRVDISYKLFCEWAEILLEGNKYTLAKDLLKLAIRDIEKLRTVFYKRERSFVGKEANKIYKKYLKIMCIERLSSLKKEVCTFQGDDEFNKLLFNIGPRSIMEQKEWGNNINELDIDLQEKKQRFEDLFFIINNMQNEGIVDERYTENLNEFFECKKYLEENHPSFKPLPLYNIINKKIYENNFEGIKEKLKDDELFYQIVLVKDYLIHNFISRETNEVIITKIDVQGYEKNMYTYKQHISKFDYELEKTSCIESIAKVCDIISDIIINPLYSYIDKDKYRKIYFMPDLTMNYINMNYMRHNNKWLIEIFDSIQNIIDWNVIGSEAKNNYGNSYLAHFFDEKDESINQIYNVIKKEEYIQISDENQSHIEINEPTKLLAIVGHGASQINGFDYMGAKKIKRSSNEYISLNDYLNINSEIENILIISCSSGTLINDYAERNNGIWASLLEKQIANILYCKWDVSTEFTTIILQKILKNMRNNQITLSKALVKAQREMCSYHPVLWAGLEVWKNE